MSESKTKFKLIEIQKFALYWDSDTSLVGDLPSKDLDVSVLLVKSCQSYVVSYITPYKYFDEIFRINSRKPPFLVTEYHFLI